MLTLAVESSNLKKYSILSQASASVLAQANAQYGCRPPYFFVDRNVPINFDPVLSPMNVIVTDHISNRPPGVVNGPDWFGYFPDPPDVRVDPLQSCGAPCPLVNSQLLTLE